MDDQGTRSSSDQALDDELAEELRRLTPLMARRRSAATARPDAGFKRALRAQLTAAPRPMRAQSAGGTWRTLIAMLLPAGPQLSLRGQGPRVVTYTADDVTITLAARPADGANEALITIYGEVDHASAGEGATMDVLRGEAVVATATLDTLGSVILPNLPPRVYALRLRFPDRREVIVPPARYDAESETDVE